MKLYDYKGGGSASQIKDADIKKGIVTGYFSSFGNKDSDGDIILPGAFARTLNAQGPDSPQPRIKHILNHDVTKPLGKLLVLREDSKGLYYESQIGTHALGKDFLLQVESGLITEHSIGFKTIKEDRKSDANYISEIKLFEGSSLNGWGANSQTPLTGLKSEFTIDMMIARGKAIERFCRTSEATDETIELLLIEMKQLQQHIISTAPASEATQPERVRNWTDVLDFIS